MRGEDVHGALIVRDIYVAMLGPVGILLALYLLYVIGVAIFRPAACPPPAVRPSRLPWTRLLVVVIGPLAFIALLLASIVTGRIYTVEAAALGAIVATVYAWARGELNWQRWAETVRMAPGGHRLCGDRSVAGRQRSDALHSGYDGLVR